MKVDVRDGDAIAGVRPRAAYAPATLADCAEIMAMAAREQLRLGFVGGGTALELGAAPTGLDAVVRTERLAQIVEYAPADMVVVALAGVTLAALQAEVGAHGQRLALDAPQPERATLGGLVATGAFGPLRARYGAIRDLIIGVTLVRADGEIARGGGKVVKNVAGFDLPKVACGSLGTLGLVAAAAFRLHPLPEVTATVRVPGLGAEAVVALLAAARAAQLEPASVVALGAADRFDLGVRFEGFGRGVAHQVARMIELAGGAGIPAAAPAQLADADAAAFWHRHDAVRASAPLRVRVAALPTRFPAVAALVAGLGELAWYATLGIGFAGGAVGDVAAATATLTTARAALVAEGGSLVVEAAPAELRAAVDPWGPPPPAFAIMERLKRRFDPEGRCNPGRFVGGL
jgi:glycolate dehydrogenase FAD-binding subunit